MAAAAAPVTLDLDSESFVPHTVVWKARYVLIDVDRASALRSDTYRAYLNSNFDKKEPFYVNWSPGDVDKLLDILRDTPELIRVDLSIKPATLAAHLMIDVSKCQKKDEDDLKKKEEDTKNEKLTYISALKKAANFIKNNAYRDNFAFPSTYKTDCVWYDCEGLIPRPLTISKAIQYLSDVPFMSEPLDTQKWEWACQGPRLSLYIKKSPRR
ncbi:MAG: hypothetical protein Hyperionvirus4_135 [Hyperionvirus sp.]|uniref:Uncharacterized protein n=1 Tax=Hyperionvirus sp. TaxID=2487770 RepID=A0A3G5A7C7_9VIRU|nr:MAG: hypothetical protein Hyperionvirus4_135 [Hyperionvirus sp.]